jgi:uncharacterized protein (TIGR03067 family)
MKILLVVSFLVFSCRVADATELTGSWRLKYTEAAGQKHFVARGITITLTIRDSTWTSVVTTRDPNASGFRARFATDDSKTPRHIDLFVTSGAPGIVWKGIYQVQGNTLKVCRTRLTSRPTRFFSSSDGKVILELYERIDS